MYLSPFSHTQDIKRKICCNPDTYLLATLNGIKTWELEIFQIICFMYQQGDTMIPHKYLTQSSSFPPSPPSHTALLRYN